MSSLGAPLLGAMDHVVTDMTAESSSASIISELMPDLNAIVVQYLAPNSEQIRSLQEFHTIQISSSIAQRLNRNEFFKAKEGSFVHRKMEEFVKRDGDFQNNPRLLDLFRGRLASEIRLNRDILPQAKVKELDLQNAIPETWTVDEMNRTGDAIEEIKATNLLAFIDYLLTNNLVPENQELHDQILTILDAPFTNQERARRLRTCLSDTPYKFGIENRDKLINLPMDLPGFVPELIPIFVENNCHATVFQLQDMIFAAAQLGNREFLEAAFNSELFLDPVIFSGSFVRLCQDGMSLPMIKMLLDSHRVPPNAVRQAFEAALFEGNFEVAQLLSHRQEIELIQLNDYLKEAPYLTCRFIQPLLFWPRFFFRVWESIIAYWTGDPVRRNPFRDLRNPYSAERKKIRQLIQAEVLHRMANAAF